MYKSNTLMKCQKNLNLDFVIPQQTVSVLIENLKEGKILILWYCFSVSTELVVNSFRYKKKERNRVKQNALKTIVLH